MHAPHHHHHHQFFLARRRLPLKAAAGGDIKRARSIARGARTSRAVPLSAPFGNFLLLIRPGASGRVGWHLPARSPPRPDALSPATPKGFPLSLLVLCPYRTLPRTFQHLPLAWPCASSSCLFLVRSESCRRPRFQHPTLTQTPRSAPIEFICVGALLEAKDPRCTQNPFVFAARSIAGPPASAPSEMDRARSQTAHLTGTRPASFPFPARGVPLRRARTLVPTLVCLPSLWRCAGPSFLLFCCCALVRKGTPTVPAQASSVACP